MSRLQKIYNESRSPFLGELAEVRDISGGLDLIEKHAETLEMVDVNTAMELIFALIKDEKYEGQIRVFNGRYPNCLTFHV